MFSSPYIADIKKENYANFAIELQKIESKIFIDEICKELVNHDIVPYTMHDGLLVPSEYEDTTLKIMQSILKESLGTIPLIKVERGKKEPSSVLKKNNDIKKI